MDFFGIGAPELVLILLVLFIIFGPSRLPEIAGLMGKAMRKLRQASAEMNRNLKEVTDEIQETGKETGKLVAGDKGLGAELKEISRELGEAARDVRDSTRIVPDIKKDLRAIAGDISAAAREPPASETKPAETVSAETKQGEDARNDGKESGS